MQRDRARSRIRRHVDTLAELYPGGVTFYLTRFGESLDAPVERGLLLEADTAEIRALATASFAS